MPTYLRNSGFLRKSLADKAAINSAKCLGMGNTTTIRSIQLQLWKKPVELSSVKHPYSHSQHLHTQHILHFRVWRLTLPLVLFCWMKGLNLIWLNDSLVLIPYLVTVTGARNNQLEHTDRLQWVRFFQRQHASLDITIEIVHLYRLYLDIDLWLRFRTDWTRWPDYLNGCFNAWKQPSFVG